MTQAIQPLFPPSSLERITPGYDCVHLDRALRLEGDATVIAGVPEDNSPAQIAFRNSPTYRFKVEATMAPLIYGAANYVRHGLGAFHPTLESIERFARAQNFDRLHIIDLMDIALDQSRVDILHDKLDSRQRKLHVLPSLPSLQSVREDLVIMHNVPHVPYAPDIFDRVETLHQRAQNLPPHFGAVTYVGALALK